jgi:Carboxypeptidase regulatory-like domain/TonB-dependent Receptor Plug Domain
MGIATSRLHRTFRACGTTFLLLLLLSLALTSSPARGQGITTGGVSGTVVDPKGAVVPGAKIIVTNLSTGAVYSQTSREDGAFSVVALPVGAYKLTISSPGFSDLTVNNVSVTVGVLTIGNEQLQIGTGVETVEASAVAPLMSTEQSQVTTSLQAESLESLPFGGGFDTVALLAPGVAITHDNSFSNNNGAYGGFSSQGQRGRANNFEIDGQSNNDNSVAGPQVFFSNQDALASIEVITNNFSAQYGRNAGSVVNYLTKSGTNSYHGSAFEFYEGNWGESFAQGQKSPFQGYCAPGQTVNCAPPTLTRYVRNRFGGTFGGPVPGMRDRLWFFGSAFFDRNHAGGGLANSGGSLTPTPAGLSTLQANFGSAPGVVALVNQGPYSIKTGNPRIFGSPVMQNVTYSGKSVPVEFAAVSRSVPSYANDEELLGRMDWQVTGKDHAFLRYFYQDDPFVNAGGSAPAGNWYNVPDTAHSIGADWVRTISPAVVNQARYSFQQTKLNFQGGALPDCTVNSPDQCTANVGISHPSGFKSNLGFGYATNIPQGRTVKVTQFQDNISWSKGKQSILIGGEFDYQNSPNPFLPDYAGAYTFGSFDSFVSGTGTITIGNSNGFTTKFTEPDAAGYFQDDYKITRNLTLNLGLRWEFFGQAVNTLHDETLKRESDAKTAFWDQSLPQYIRIVPAVPDSWRQFQPRLGFAYNPEFDTKMVIRGGFSYNFDPAFYNMFLNAATAAPVINLGTIRGCGTTKNCMPSTGVKGSDVRALNLPYLPVGPGINPGSRNQTRMSPNFHNPYTESWIFGFSHQLGGNAVMEINYVGNHQVGNFASTNGNPYVLPVQGDFPQQAAVSLCNDPTQVGYGRPDCNLTNVRERNNGGFALYNSLQSNITTRNFHGLTTNTNFTYSKTIDNTSEIFSTFAGGNSITFASNPLNPNEPERAESGNSMKFIGSSQFGYKLPDYNHASGFLGRVLSGYHLDTIWTFNTGQPMTPFQYGFFGGFAGGPYDPYGYGPNVVSYGDEFFNNWQLSGYDTSRPLLVNPKAPITKVGIYESAAFGYNICGNTLADGKTPYTGWEDWQTCAPAADGSQFHWARNTAATSQLLTHNAYGGVGRNSSHGGSWNNFDVALQKQTKLTERLNMTLSVISYNAMNRQFKGSPYDLDIDDTGSTFYDYGWNYGSNRTTQLKAQFQF